MADGESVRAVVAGLDALHIIINDAGDSRPAMFAKMDEATFRSVLDVHLVGTFNVSKAALPLLPDEGRGRIMNSTSAAGLVGTIGQANYAAAKAAIVGFAIWLAKELARKSITANCVAPLAATAMTETVRTEPRSRAELEGIRLGALGESTTRSRAPSPSLAWTRTRHTSPGRSCASTAGW